LQEEEENKNYQILNKKQKNYEKRKKNIIDPDKSFEKMKKLYKTNSTNIFNNNNTLLYLKPRNKKSLQSYYYSNMNSNNNIASNPFLYNTNNNNQIMDNHLLKYNTNDYNDDTDNSILNNYMSNKNNNLDLTDTELLFTKKIRQNSLNKIYKKPIYKTTNISKKSPNHKDKNADSNSVTNKDENIYSDKNNNKTSYNELIFSDKNNRTIDNINFNQNHNIYRLNNINKQYDEDFNQFSDNDFYYEDSLKTIFKTLKNGFIKKYYNHCINLPVTKKHYLTKKYVYKYKNNAKKKQILCIN
jgi:hypothetical protein